MADIPELFEFRFGNLSEEEAEAILDAYVNDEGADAVETQKVLDYYDTLAFQWRIVMELIMAGKVDIRWSAEKKEPVYRPRMQG